MDEWGDFVIKENVKKIKLALKLWHQNHTKNLLGRILLLKERFSLDCKGENLLLLEDEEEELHVLIAELFSLYRINISICWKQPRLIWLREGDANSKIFHGVISS